MTIQKHDLGVIKRKRYEDENPWGKEKKPRVRSKFLHWCREDGHLPSCHVDTCPSLGRFR